MTDCNPIEQQARQDQLEALYLADGRDNPEHPMHSTYTGLAQAASTDEPAVPEGREPAAVTGQPSDQELLDIAASTIEPYERSGIATDEYEPETESAVEAYGSELIAYARAVLARWGNLKESLTSSPPADGEVADRAAELLQRQALVMAWKRLPGPGDCDAEGRCWWFCPPDFIELRSHTSAESAFVAGATHCLPAHALPLPEVNNG